jgi:signal transduction histidine kinase
VRYGGKTTTICFSVQESGNNHIIVCEDDGDGVVAEEKETIFDRGFGKNTGMGLFLSREILAITGITIRETGEPGMGHGSRWRCRKELTGLKIPRNFKRDRVKIRNWPSDPKQETVVNACFTRSSGRGTMPRCDAGQTTARTCFW